MKRLITVCLVCVLTTAAWSVTAVPPQEMTISFDENGNGSYTYNDGLIEYPLSWTTGTPPGGHTTLCYQLPQPLVVGGDVWIYEPDTGYQTSDVLRFVTVVHTDDTVDYWVYVYSDLPEAGETPELADTGIPIEYITPMLSLPEEGAEGGWNGLHYTPSPNYPGYMGSQWEVTYIFTSDVPEPATICLLGLGALSFVRGKNKQENLNKRN